MSIFRRLTLLMLLSLAGALVCVVVVVRAQTLAGERIHAERTRAEAHTAEQVLALTGAPLVSYVADYTRWDELAALVRTCDAAWAEANLKATMATFQADAVWVFGADGQRCYATDPASTLGPSGLGLAAPPPAGEQHHGFAYLEGQLWELAAATIHPGADRGRATPPLGWMVVARRFDDPALRQLATVLSSQVRVDTGAGAGAAAADAGGVGTSVTRIALHDLQGVPVATLTVVSEHPLARELERVAIEAGGLVAVINLVIVLLLGQGLARWVVRPVRTLTHSLQAAQPAALEKLVRQGGEFGQLAQLVQAFFAQHQQLAHAITARGQADATLRSFFDGAAVMMGVVELLDDDILHRSDNAATLRFFGLPPDLPFPYRASVAGVPQEHIHLWLAQYHTCARQQAPVTFEYEHQARDGPHWLAATVSPIAGADTRFAYLVQDVTARKRTEAALQESEQRFRGMFERHEAIMLLVDPHSGTIVDANQAAATFYGYTLVELRQMQIEAINQLPLEQVAAERERALAERRNYFIFPHRLASGEIRTVEVHSTPISVGAQALLFSIIHDITVRTRMEVAEREQRALAEALRDTAIALTSTLSVDAVLDRILERVGQVVPHDAVSVLLLDADGDTVSVTRRHGDPAWDAADAGRVRFPLALMPTLIQMVRTGQAVAIAATPVDLTGADAATAAWARSYAGAPLRIRQRTMGFLTVESATPGFFTPVHADRLQALANQTAIAIEHARLYAEVEALAIADPLTGVANRRGLFQVGVREVERAVRNHTPLALIMLDLDHFKRINDTYGHPMGDRVLLAVTACCRATVRSIDVIARYGGEEFLLLLPDTDLEDAAGVAERLRRAVELLAVPEAGETRSFSPTIHVTASLGVGALTADTSTLEALIERVDRALYAAKRAGRNQVCSAGCDEPVTSAVR